MNTNGSTNKITQIISATFILLWVYTAGSKLTSFETYRLEMQHQVFSNTVSSLLTFIIPTVEILAAVLLLFQKTNRAGLIFSLLMISFFTGYIILIITGYFPKVPCSCGGVIRSLGWKGHLIFNLFFLTAAILALYNTPKREVGDKE